MIHKNISGELQSLGRSGSYLYLLMGCHHYHAAVFQMLFHQFLYQFHSSDIQSRQRLVQYPQYGTAHQ